MPRPLHEQVVVITGASSGIGRETAVAFGRRGASIVLAARGERGLRDAAAEVEKAGGKAHWMVTDVADFEQVEQLAIGAVSRFGRIDTWINNAGIGAYGTVEQMEPQEVERIIHVNLLGVMYGCRAALPHLKRHGGGTIINVGSALSDRAVPLISAYVASKFAVKGFTDALRLDLRYERAPVEVVLVLPASINTPLFRNARSKIGVKPAPIPPVYDPSVVADAILVAAQRPQRQVYAGGAGRLLSIMERLSPALLDWYMTQGDRMARTQMSDRPDDGRDNLFEPMAGAEARGEWGARTLRGSLYARQLTLHPRRGRLLLAAGVVGAALLLRRLGR